MIDHALMQRAIEKWGTELQMDLAVEECAELIQAIQHYKRGRKNSREKIVEEIAYVAVMVYQLQLMFGVPEVEKVIDSKMKRLKMRLDAGTWEDPTR